MTPAAAGARGGNEGALGRGLRVLEMLASALAPRSLSAIAEAVKLDVTTTSRLLRSLEMAGYVLRDPQTRTYVASPKALLPLPLTHPLTVVRQEVQPILHGLSRELAHTVLLILFVQRERMVVGLAQYPGSLTPYFDTWPRNPLHTTASGKVLLLAMDPGERARYLGPGPLEKFGPGTVTEVDALERELREAELRGFVVTVDAAMVGATAVGAPVRSWTGEITGCLVATAVSSGLTPDAITSVGSSLAREANLLSAAVPSLQQTAGLFDVR